MMHIIYRISIFIFFSLCISCPSFSDDIIRGKEAFNARKYDKALDYFIAAYREGSNEGGYYLARMLEGGFGADRGFEKALYLYHETAEKNFPPSLNRLGTYYYNGFADNKPDYTKAKEYFERAVKFDDKNALHNMGKLYLLGQGVARDENKAIILFDRAANQGHVLSLNLLGSMYKKTAKTREDLKKALFYFETSASYGNALGMYELALLYLALGNSPETLVIAHKNLNLAAARGLNIAREKLISLSKKMPLSDIEKAQYLAKKYKSRNQ